MSKYFPVIWKDAKKKVRAWIIAALVIYMLVQTPAWIKTRTAIHNTAVTNRPTHTHTQKNGQRLLNQTWRGSLSLWTTSTHVWKWSASCTRGSVSRNSLKSHCYSARSVCVQQKSLFCWLRLVRCVSHASHTLILHTTRQSIYTTLHTHTQQPDNLMNFYTFSPIYIVYI